ncbi:MAG TPA: relaxase/mobilization nuclease domain-containing protein [Steroidobacteraceae bacterium]|nr:relaxase/mobilization nuclease domain-containing protein [Steroidobacteraceae bacterium]
MSRLNVSLFEHRALFDIASYARRGPGRRDHLSPEEIAQIGRTVRRAPEVMVKVLPRGSSETAAVRKHLDYISRDGALELETDEGETVSRQAGQRVIDDWDLALDEERGGLQLSADSQRKTPRLVHKLILSMPAGTPPEKLLRAARGFLREEFALKHRYAFVLHTDEPHPHVHAVIKAVSDQGERLYVKKATLRHWRSEFARHLRAQGVEANATERAVRGQIKSPKIDGIYRAERRGDSKYTQARVQAVGAELRQGCLSPDLGKATLVRTRRQVEEGWAAVNELLLQRGQIELAAHARQFVSRMPSPRTDREQIGMELVARLSKRQMLDQQPTR